MLRYKIRNSKKIKNNIDIFNTPKKVFIPLINGNDDDVTVLVKKGDNVKIGQILAKTKGDLRTPIISSVSGKVIETKTMSYLDSRKVKCLVIENDFDEALNTVDIKKKYNKKDFITLLQEKAIVDMGGTSYPTYVKYDTKKKIKKLIVDVTESEEYITSNYILVKNHCEEILEAIDMIMEINKIDDCVIAIRKENNDLKNLIDSYLGTYPNIKIKMLPNIYPIGNERILVKKITGETYKLIPNEKGIVVNNSSTIYAMYKALKYGNPLTERIISIHGLNDNDINVLVKTGTLVKDIINNFGKLDNDKIYVTNSILNGHKVDMDSLVVSSNLTGIIILNEEKCEEKECIRCGKCVEICPRKLTPVLIKENLENKKSLKSLKVNRCIDCGLCSNICPAKIDFKKILDQARMKGGK